MTVERWFLDSREQCIKEEALRQTIKCALEGYDIRAEGIKRAEHVVKDAGHTPSKHPPSLTHLPPLGQSTHLLTSPSHFLQ